MKIDTSPEELRALAAKWLNGAPAISTGGAMCDTLRAVADEKQAQKPVDWVDEQRGETDADRAHRTATELAMHLAKKHWPELTQWRPQPDLLGVITQIDNMTCGMVRMPLPEGPKTRSQRQPLTRRGKTKNKKGPSGPFLMSACTA